MEQLIRPNQDKMKMLLKTLLPHSARNWLGSQMARRQDRRLFLTSLRSSDVFVVGHPKSGNTLMAYMIGCLLEKRFDKTVTLANVGSFVPTIHSGDSMISKHGGLPSPRIFRTEDPCYPESYPKTIYLIRDPRSVLVSYYHHCVHDLGNSAWSISDFVREMLTYGCIRQLEPQLVRWDRQVMAWHERAKSQRVMMVKYEDMVKNRREILKRVSEFAEIPCDDREIVLAAERGSFENMRKIEEKYGAESYRGEKGARGFFVRRGKTDGWKEELPPEVAGNIEAEFAEAMRKVGYMNEKTDQASENPANRSRQWQPTKCN